MDIKKWNIWLRSEMAIVILFLLGMAAYYQTKVNLSDRYSVNIFMGVAASIIIAIVLLIDFLKSRSQRMTTISRWLEILIIPMALSLTWEGLFGILLNRTGAKGVLTIIFGLILLVLYLPIAVVDVGRIKNSFGRMIAACFFPLMIIASDDVNLRTGLWSALVNTGFLAAIATFICALFISKSWGFGYDPNLKFQKLNRSQTVSLVVLLALMIWFVFWNQFCGDGNNLWQVLFKVDISSFELTWNVWFVALEAGIFEETFRYLMIIALIAGLANSKYQLEWTIIISSVIFGLMHFTNLGMQKFAATLSQATYAGAAGLLFAILYLYTGKIWVPMLFHFANDFLNYAQVGGMTAQTWSGDANDWLNLLVQVLVPVAITIWMLTGQRRLLMKQNIARLLDRDNYEEKF